MIQPNTLSYERWLDLYAAPATSLTITYGGAIDDRTSHAAAEHEYRLDWSRGSDAVETHAWSKQLTPDSWLNAIRSGLRTTAESAENAERDERELLGAW